MRTLDDVYGPDLDDFPLEQECATLHAHLQWDERESRPDPRLPAWAYGPVWRPAPPSMPPQSSERFTALATRR